MFCARWDGEEIFLCEKPLNELRASDVHDWICDAHIREVPWPGKSDQAGTVIFTYSLLEPEDAESESGVGPHFDRVLTLATELQRRFTHDSMCCRGWTVHLIAQWPQDTIPDLARKRAVDQYITARLGLPTAGFVVDAAFWHPITRPRLVWCSCWETERREELEASFRELKGDFTFRARPAQTVSCGLFGVGPSGCV